MVFAVGIWMRFAIPMQYVCTMHHADDAFTIQYGYDYHLTIPCQAQAQDQTPLLRRNMPAIVLP